jgi:uncharacterized protein YjbI with pentapeptide repeats/tetratricopeptide (TPR) repeat protein
VLTGASARGADLTGGHLREADLRGTDLENALLLGARLDGSDLDGARLAGADLSRSSILRVSLEDADLTGARLIGVRAEEARMARARLERTTLTLGDFGAAHLFRARLSGADLTGCHLGRATLIRADLTGVLGIGCSLAGADLTGSQLRGAKLIAADLTGAVLVGCDLRGADLTGAKLTGVQGLASARTDDDTCWPAGWSPGSTAAAPAGPAAPWPAAAGCRRLAVMGADTAAGWAAQALASELLAQQCLAGVRQPGARISLPLGVRTPRSLGIQPSGRRWWRPHLHGTARLRVRVHGAPGARIVRATLSLRGHTFTLPEVAVDQRPSTAPGQAPYPSMVEELAAQVLDVLDPRDSAPWLTRAYVARAMGRWDIQGTAALPECRRDLLAAVAVDPLGPVVNYALGALAYNEYDDEPTRRAIAHFAVAHVSAGRLAPALVGLSGLTLSGLALSYCQLYHRFGVETAGVLACSRTAAGLAVVTARSRLRRRRDPPRIRRNALEGYALARYAEAFAQHITELRDDVRTSIPLYEDAIGTLNRAQVAIPAVLYNNLGYQHMTLAGRMEPGPDKAGYRAARQLFQTAVRHSSELHFGWANLGNVDRLLGDLVAAEASYRRAVEITERNGQKYPQGWNELAWVLLTGGRGRAVPPAGCRRCLIGSDPGQVDGRIRSGSAAGRPARGCGRRCRAWPGRRSAQPALSAHPRRRQIRGMTGNRTAPDQNGPDQTATGTPSARATRRLRRRGSVFAVSPGGRRGRGGRAGGGVLRRVGGVWSTMSCGEADNPAMQTGQ